MQLHHDTDTIFHRQGWFLDLEHELLDDLTADGRPAPAARSRARTSVSSCLLDGELLRAEDTAAAVVDVYGSMASPPWRRARRRRRPEQRARGPSTSAGIAERLDPFALRRPGLRRAAPAPHHVVAPAPRVRARADRHRRHAPRRPCSPRSRRRRPTCSHGSRRRSGDVAWEYPTSAVAFTVANRPAHPSGPEQRQAGTRNGQLPRAARQGEAARSARSSPQGPRRAWATRRSSTCASRTSTTRA